MDSHAREVELGRRFEFGKNWQRFLRVLNEERIAEAEKSLRAMLEIESLAGKSFLDVGSGSGLFSLAAMRLGARKVHSFDFDPQSVACTRELKRRYFPECDPWTIEEGSVLNSQYLASLGQFDVVYAWGVLHHTGQMWQALEAVIPLVAKEGRLYLAIYNDRGIRSRFWRSVKRFYNVGLLGRVPVLGIFIPFFAARGLASDLVHLRNPLSRYLLSGKNSRGMSVVRDWFDWLGGYPFEFATPEAILEFYRKRGFKPAKLKTTSSSLGNNEYVFVKNAA